MRALLLCWTPAMTFCRIDADLPASNTDDLPDEALLRYSRHILLPEIGIEGQRRLMQSRALVVGVGGLGSPVALYLAAAGVGQLVLADGDTVELTNLQRQIVHDSASLGQAKVASAQQRLTAINPLCQVTALACVLDGALLEQQVAAADVVVDCCDNFATRHAVNAACVRFGKPLVSGAAVRFDGQLAVFDNRDPDSACYHCLFPDHGEASDGPCASFGVLAPLVGVIGSLQAVEALKLLAGIGEPATGRLQTYDARNGQWRSLRFGQDPNCPVCGPRQQNQATTT